MAVILFDLGGVLVQSIGRSVLEQLLPHLGADQVLERWMQSASVGLFERGRMSEAEFAAAFVHEWALPLDEQAFLESFAGWVPGHLEGAPQLIRALRGEHQVGCLSNTNAIHWRRMQELVGLFDFRFASHLTGFMKPDRQAYEVVISSLGVPPGEIHFFDDLQPNVEAARALGINAYLARGPGEVETILRSRGLLSG